MVAPAKDARKGFLKIFFALLFLWVFLPAGAWADVIYEEEVIQGPPPGQPVKRLVVYQKGQLRREETFISQAGQVVILRLNKDWMWIGDKATKTSTEGSWDEMSGRLLIDRPQPVIEIKATGEKKELLGYMTEKFIIQEENNGSPARLEVYISNDMVVDEEVNKFNAVFWKKMDLKSEYQASWRSKIKGFPLLTIRKVVDASGRENITTTRVTSFQEVLMDYREFEPPLVFK